MVKGWSERREGAEQRGRGERKKMGLILNVVKCKYGGRRASVTNANEEAVMEWTERRIEKRNTVDR